MAQTHLRAIDPYLEVIPQQPKHKYAFPMNRRMRKLLKGMALPYPKGEA